MGLFKKHALAKGGGAAQQGRRGFGARSVHGVRKDDKGPSTQLADFFNWLIINFQPEWE
jgi:hypothetical protein